MELIKERAVTGEVVYADSFCVSGDGDLIVPDVKPDIMKVLQVDADVCVASENISDGKLTVGGKMNFTVIYLPEGEQNAPQAIHTSVEFSHKIDNPDIKGDCTATVNADISKVDFHVINSRKISLKATAEICCEIMRRRFAEFAASASEWAELCREEIELNTLVGVHGEEFFVKDFFEIPAGKASAQEILRLEYKICDKEIRALTEKLVLKGTLELNMLYLGADGEIEYVDERMPFTEVFDFPDLTEEDICDVNIRVCDFNYESAEDGNGRIINVELSAVAEMKSERKEIYEIITDCFMPGRKTKLTYEETEIKCAAATAVMQETLRESAVAPTGDAAIKTVYNAAAKVFVTKAEARNSKISVCGRAEVFILYISDNPDKPICAFKKDIPFDYLLDCPGASEGAEVCVDSEVCHVGYHLNAAGEVEIRCILSLAARVFEKRRLKLIGEAETEEIPRDKRKGIVIYFVQPEDNLWKIAKEYCVSPSDIAEFNDISEASKISVGQRLIIPAKRC